MGIYPWNKFWYLTCEISFFPPELLLHSYKCVIGYVPCCVMVNTHTIVNWNNETDENKVVALSLYLYIKIKHLFILNQIISLASSITQITQIKIPRNVFDDFVT